MNRSLLPLVLAAFLLCMSGGCATMPQGADDARKAAFAWLSLVDGGDYQKAYADRPPRILAGSDKDRFLRFMQSRRAPLGQPKNRDLTNISFTSKLNGAPDGSYAVLIYRTAFEHKTDSHERVILTRETGQWEVSGYSFR